MPRYMLEVVYETDENQEGIDSRQIMSALTPILLKGNRGADLLFHSIGLFPHPTWHDSRPAFGLPRPEDPRMADESLPVAPKDSRSWFRRLWGGR